jgi:transcriptional regulator with XRE-family HTH domain
MLLLMIAPLQIRAARALLNWTQADLAKHAKMSVTGLNNLERGASDPKASTLRAIQGALEVAGVEFIAENGGGAGVRLRKR